ncbi:MAG: hypothetical protein ACLFTH_02100 [Candidatus Woesearchaeota archaeon]
MSLEAIVTDVWVESHKDRLGVALWKHGSIYIPYTHTFPSRHMNESLLNDTLKKLKSHPATKDLHVEINKNILDSKKNKGLSNLFLYGPPSIAREFDKELNARFFTGHYTEHAKETLIRPGEIITTNDELADTLSKIKEYNRGLDTIREEILAFEKGLDKGTVTRRFNKLDERMRKKGIDSVDEATRLKTGEQAVKTRSMIEDIYKRAEKQTPYSISRENGRAEITIPDLDFIEKRRGITGEELHQLPWVDLDIEIPFFKRPAEAMISWVGTIYHQQGEVRKVIYTLSDPGSEKWNGYEIKRFPNQSRLLQTVARDILEYDPLTISAYNNKFDFIKLNEEGTFSIGLDKKTPVHEATTKFFERIGTRGRIMIDRLRWAQMAYKYLPNKKLDLIGKEVLGSEAFSKTITYDEMDELEGIALYHHDRHERVKAAQTIATYLTGDVDVLLDMHNSEEFRWSLEFGARLAEQDNLAIQLPFYSTRAVQQRQKMDFFKKNKIYKDDLFLNTKEARQEYSNAKQRFKYHLSDISNLRAKPGIYTDVKLIQINYAKTFSEELMKFYPHAKHLLGMKPETSFQQEYITNILNSACDWLVSDTMTLHKRERNLLHKRQQLNIPYEAEQDIKTQLARYEGKYFTKEFVKEAARKVEQELGKTPDEQKMKRYLKDLYWHRRYKRRFYAQYKQNVEMMDVKLRELDATIKHKLSAYNLKPIHQEGSYLYVVGDSTRFEQDYPTRVITSFDKVYLSEEFNDDEHKNVKEGRQKIYYKRHGFYKGVSIKEEPSNNLTLFEMETYKGFLDNIFAGRYESAISHLTRQQLKVDLKNVSLEELVMKSKKKTPEQRDRYKALEAGGTIYFYTRGENNLPVDEETGRAYEIQNIHTKDRTVYIMNINDLKPDWHLYQRRHEQIVYNIAYHTVKKDLLLDALVETWKQSLFLEPTIRKAADELRQRTF